MARGASEDAGMSFIKGIKAQAAILSIGARDLLTSFLGARRP